MQTESQKQMILEYLLTGCSITQLEALTLFSCFNLRNRVSELNREGFHIKKKMVKVTNKFNKHVHVAKYSM